MIQAGCTASVAPMAQLYTSPFSNKSDWYLPSIAEMQTMYTNLSAAGVGDFFTSINGDDGIRWTSTSQGSLENWSFSFRTGQPTLVPYDDVAHNYSTIQQYRAVRAF